MEFFPALIFLSSYNRYCHVGCWQLNDGGCGASVDLTWIGEEAEGRLCVQTQEVTAKVE